MGTFEDDLIKNIQGQAATHAEAKAKEPPLPDGQRPEYVEVDKLDDKGQPAGKQVIERHTGLHTSPSSEEILGKRKIVPKLIRGVVLDKDGHVVALGGGSHGESGLVPRS